MPDIVATRQNQQNQQKQQMIKSEPPEANGEEAKPGNICHNIQIPSAY